MIELSFPSVTGRLERVRQFCAMVPVTSLSKRPASLEELQLAEYIVGLIEPEADALPRPVANGSEGSTAESDSEDEEEDTGLDIEEARERLVLLGELNKKALAAAKRYNPCWHGQCR